MFGCSVVLVILHILSSCLFVILRTCHPDGTEGSLNLYTLRIITITDTISFCEDNVFYIKEVIFSNKISLCNSIALLFLLAEVFVERGNHQCLTYTAFMEQ